jgi:putative SOS response-associated peptidase YedK
MCGRYYRRSDKQRIAEAFKVGKLPSGFELAPDYNIAPDTFQPVIRPDFETGDRELVSMRWGMVPWFAKTEDEFKELSTINAKASRLQESNMWREPFKRRRCLVPADGLYEWPKPGHAISPTYEIPSDDIQSPAVTGDLFGPPMSAPRKPKPGKLIKRVFNITLADQDALPFAFAGIWDSWKRPDGTRLESYAIVTTEPNDLVATIHDRLALILRPKDYGRWLTVDDDDLRPPIDLLHPFDSEAMQMLPANPAVGNWRNNGPEMLNGTSILG